jgi:integrase
VDLMKLKEVSKGNKIFSMSKKTVNKMMSYIRDNMGFGNRKITFHSFKKAIVTRMGELTQGNIKMMQRHGNHQSESMTMDNYVKNAGIEDMLVIDVNHNLDLSVLDGCQRLNC